MGADTLPATFVFSPGNSLTYLSGEISLRPDGTYEMVTSYRHVSPREDSLRTKTTSGPYRHRGNRLWLVHDGDSTAFSVAADTIVYRGWFLPPLFFVKRGPPPDTVPQTHAARAPCAATAGPLPDSIVSPDGRFTVHFEIVEAGRDSVVILPASGGPPVLTFTNGILDLYWLPGSHGVVYSVGPIYDAPGIFMRKLGSKNAVVVVKPRIRNAANPDGADWIRLCGVERTDSTTWLRIARFGDVARIDFRHPPPPVIEKVEIPQSR